MVIGSIHAPLPQERNGVATQNMLLHAIAWAGTQPVDELVDYKAAPVPQRHDVKPRCDHGARPRRSADEGESCLRSTWCSSDRERIEGIRQWYISSLQSACSAGLCCPQPYRSITTRHMAKPLLAPVGQHPHWLTGCQQRGGAVGCGDDRSHRYPNHLERLHCADADYHRHLRRYCEDRTAQHIHFGHSASLIAGIDGNQYRHLQHIERPAGLELLFAARSRGDPHAHFVGWPTGGGRECHGSS